MTGKSTSFERWFSEHRDSLSAGGLSLDGGEPGRMPAAGFAEAKIRLLLARPSTYDDVRPSITHRLLYWAARQVSGVYVDMAFLPPARDIAIMRRDNVPLWLASGCKRSPRDFDVVGVSLSVQQEAWNLPALMHGSGLELAAARRAADPTHPLIVLGGHAAASTPFLHGNVDGEGSGGLVDVVCNGDGVTWLQEFLRVCLAVKDAGGGRDAIIRGLMKRVPGSYVPAGYDHVYEDGTLRLSSCDGTVMPVAYRKDPHDAWLGGYDGACIPFAQEETEETIPLAAGCVYRCRFCQSGWVRGGHDVAAVEGLLAAATRIKANTAASDLNLLASDACSVKGLCGLVDRLSDVFERISLKSLAVPMLARHRELRALVRRIEKTEFTFGVEGISERLRDYLGKSVSTEDLCSVLREISSSGLRQAKLFFIMTGREDESDVEEFAELLRKVRRNVGGTRVIISFMPLFHAPFTPMQFDEVLPLRDIIMMQVEAVAKGAGCEFRWSTEPAEIRMMNLLCRAGRRATKCVVDLCRDVQQLYYEDIPAALCRDMERRLVDAGLDVVALMRGVRKGESLPWDDLSSGTKRELLWRSHRKGCDLLDGKHGHIEKLERIAGGVGGGDVPRVAEGRGRTEPAIRRFVCRIGMEQARRPDVSVARGLLREWLLRDASATRAYAGRPAVTRFPGAWGLVLLQGRFREQLLGDGLPKNVPGFLTTDREVAAWDMDGLLYLLCLSDGAEVESVLKDARIPFQSVRRDGALWSVVGANHRRRVGITTVERRTSGEVRVLCSGAVVDFLTRVHAAPWVGAECIGFFAEEAGRGGALRCLHFTGDVDSTWSGPDRLLERPQK